VKKLIHTSPKDAVCLPLISCRARRGENAVSGSMNPVLPMCISPSSVTVRPWCSHNSLASVASSNTSSLISSVSGYYTTQPLSYINSWSVLLIYTRWAIKNMVIWMQFWPILTNFSNFYTAMNGNENKHEKKTHLLTKACIFTQTHIICKVICQL